ncbi:MAG: hypothetical protein GY799_17365 [Desulfobulbaceae bacterium]|nr:hypothetical protein [Desulfobulbaceae bacterium]
MKNLILILLCLGLTGCTSIDPHVANAIYKDQLQGTWGIVIMAKKGDPTPIKSPFGKLRIILKDGKVLFKDPPDNLDELGFDRFAVETVEYSVETSPFYKKFSLTTTTAYDEVMNVKFDMKFISGTMVSLSNISMYAPQNNNADMTSLFPAEAKELRLYLKKITP